MANASKCLSQSFRSFAAWARPCLGEGGFATFPACLLNVAAKRQSAHAIIFLPNAMETPIYMAAKPYPFRPPLMSLVQIIL